MSATNNTEFVIINGNKILKEDEEDYNELEKVCDPPCKIRPMMGRSWWKCYGYNSPCSCAYHAEAKYKECLFKCGRIRMKKSRDSDCFGCSGEKGNCSCTTKEYWNLCDECFEINCGND